MGGERREEKGRGGGVLMLFLRDRGEGHKPSANGFLKEENSIVPSGHLSIHPFCPSPSTWLFMLRDGRGGGGVLWVCLGTLNNARSTSNPHIALSRKNSPTSSASGSAISISESFVLLCCCYLLQYHFSFLHLLLLLLLFLAEIL